MAALLLPDMLFMTDSDGVLEHDSRRLSFCMRAASTPVMDLVLPVASRPHLNARDAVAGSADDQAGA